MTKSDTPAPSWQRLERAERAGKPAVVEPDLRTPYAAPATITKVAPAAPKAIPAAAPDGVRREVETLESGTVKETFYGVRDGVRAHPPAFRPSRLLRASPRRLHRR